jgi:bifunctional UDP-N-acetylglucosamine pyrophosphorylase/glucosamine-1-phosphate N-acetyltransferase
VLYADHPLLKKGTLKKLLHYHRENYPEVTLLTAKLKNPSGYGRILRDKYGSISRIVEEKDADSFQKDIKEINIGCACFNAQKLLTALKKVRRNNRKREYYLTDVIEIIYKAGGRIESVKLLDPTEGQGINSRSDLARANRIMQARIIQEHLENGVGVVDPQTTFIDWDVAIGADTRIYPFTVIERDVKIGKRCSIGPFAHLRPGTTIESDSAVGNFVELVRCKVSRYTLAKHFCYLGDTKVGSNVNIGAGVVTANFDGRKKNTSIIKDNAFLGCDTVLVAPVKIGKGAVTGAGAVVPKNKNVADHTVVVGMPARVIKKRG